jgi:hypothetical protein
MTGGQLTQQDDEYTIYEAFLQMNIEVRDKT